MLREQKERLKVVLSLILFLVFIFVVICGSYYLVTGKPIIIDSVVNKNKSIQNDKEFRFVEEDNTMMTCVATGMTFGNNIDKLSWEKGYMEFEGDADETAKLFFEYVLKEMIDEYIKYELEKGDIKVSGTIEMEYESEQILFQITTTGEFAKTFKPEWFLKVDGTDLSRCLIDDRLRIDLNEEIYWIRLEKDKGFSDISKKIFIFGNVTRVVEE